MAEVHCSHVHCCALLCCPANFYLTSTDVLSPCCHILAYFTTRSNAVLASDHPQGSHRIQHHAHHTGRAKQPATSIAFPYLCRPRPQAPVGH